MRIEVSANDGCYCGSGGGGSPWTERRDPCSLHYEGGASNDSLSSWSSGWGVVVYLPNLLKSPNEEAEFYKAWILHATSKDLVRQKSRCYSVTKTAIPRSFFCSLAYRSEEACP